MSGIFFKLSTYILVISTLGGCGDISPTGVNLTYLTLETDPNTNDDKPLPLDLLIIYDEECWNKVKKLTSQQYFDSLEQLYRDFPGTGHCWKWELVPGESIGPYKLGQPLSSTSEFTKAYGAIIFAGYRTPGEHRLIINHHNAIKVTLGEKSIKSISPVPLTSEAPILFPSNAPSLTS